MAFITTEIFYLNTYFLLFKKKFLKFTNENKFTLNIYSLYLILTNIDFWSIKCSS